MKLIRTPARSNYTKVPNAVIRDPRLSTLSCWILAYMLSNTDDFNANVTALGLWRRARKARGDRAESRKAHLDAFNELIEFGYMVRERKRLGSRLVTVVTVYEVPRLGLTGPGKSEPEQSGTGKSNTQRNTGTRTREEGGPSGSETSTTQNRGAKDRNGLWELLARIPDRSLLNPQADRSTLERRALKLLRAGLIPQQLRVLLSGITGLGRPFGALMRRMADLKSALAFLDGDLGQGVHRPWRPGVDWSSGPWEQQPHPEQAEGEGDLFDRPPEFVTDALSKASHTCPEHPAVRNLPGGLCVLCQRPCRSVPGEVMHPEAPPPTPWRTPGSAEAALGALPAPRSGLDPTGERAEPVAADDPPVDPQVLARMHESLKSGSEGPRSDPGPKETRHGLVPPQGGGVARTGAAQARAILARALKNDPAGVHARPPEHAVNARGVTSGGVPGGG